MPDIHFTYFVDAEIFAGAIQVWMASSSGISPRVRIPPREQVASRLRKTREKYAPALFTSRSTRIQWRIGLVAQGFFDASSRYLVKRPRSVVVVICENIFVLRPFLMSFSLVGRSRPSLEVDPCVVVTAPGGAAPRCGVRTKRHRDGAFALNFQTEGIRSTAASLIYRKDRHD